MALEVRVRLSRGDLQLDVTLRADAGALVVLVGPNGAGKTTLLRALAGLERIDEGCVALDGATLDDADDTFVPPHRRRVGLVPQSDQLLPHLTALDNVAFGLRRAGARRRAAREEAARWLALVGLEALGGHRPAQLSGGQAKRVSLARALAVRPRLLLMDEPLASLDATTRRQVRRELREYLAAHECVRILVTHEPIDALALADRIVVLEQGRVVQDVSPEELRVRPRSRYVADLVGVNLYRGTLTAAGLRTDEGVEIVAADRLAETGAGLAVIHPRAVALHSERPVGSARNVWQGTVTELDDEGDRFRLRLQGPIPLVAEVTRAGAASLEVETGSRIYASVKATEVSLYPA